MSMIAVAAACVIGFVAATLRLRAGLSEQAGQARRAVHGRQRHRHPRAHRRPEAVGDVGPAGDRRQPPRRRRHDRRRRSSRSRRRDGYTLLVHSAAHAYNPAIYPNLPTTRSRTSSKSCRWPGSRTCWSWRRRPVSRRSPSSSRRRRRSPGRSISPRPAPAAARTSTARSSSSPPASTCVHIPYKGTPEALTDTMAGRVTYFFSPISAALPQRARRQARRAGREHRQALERAAERADDRRSRACPASTTTCGSACSRRPARLPTSSTRSTRDVRGRAGDARGPRAPRGAGRRARCR